MKAEVALFKALSDPTRLRLAVLLASREDACVCELAEALGDPEFKISRHLGVMRSAGLVDARREGTWMHYRLVESRSALEKCLQDCFRECLNNHPVVKKDFKKFAKAACRRTDDDKCKKRPV